MIIIAIYLFIFFFSRITYAILQAVLFMCLFLFLFIYWFFFFVRMYRGSGKAPAGLSTEPRAGAEHRSQLLSDYLPGTNQTSWQNGHLYPRGRVAEGKLRCVSGVSGRAGKSMSHFLLSPYSVRYISTCIYIYTQTIICMRAYKI